MRRKNVYNQDGFIAKDGQSNYIIIIANNSEPSLVYAGEELQRLIQLSSNCKIEILSEPKNKPAIYLGTNKVIDESQKNRNGFVIKTIDKDVYIDGADKTGLLFGVYRFMEITSDYMYLDEDETLIGEGVKFMNIDYWDYPDFQNRDVYNYDTKHFPAHARRLFLSGGNFSYQEEKYGEGSWWSTLYDQSLCEQLLNHNIYREKFPHWYSSPNESVFQICYTEGLYSRDRYEKGDFSEENYDDGRHGMFWTLVYNLITKYIAVQTEKQVFQLGMNDNQVFCDCPRCKKDIEKYGKSGVCIRFINAVADEVEKWRLANCSDRKIYLSVFAYYSCFEAPVKYINNEYVPLDNSVIVRDNVIVRFTPMDAFYMFPLNDKEHNPLIANSLEGWSRVAKHFAVWDYRIDFWAMIAPFPQWMGAEQTMRAYYQYGFVDVMYQGCTQTSSTPFVALDNYVRSRFSWDTTSDYNGLTQFFIKNYYQECGFAINEYRELLTEHYKKIYIEQDYKGHSHHGVARRYYFPFEVIEKIENIFKKGYTELEKIRDKEPERYEKLKVRLDKESLFYRFMKVAFYPEHYTNSERIEEIGNFEKIAKKVKLKVVCNKDDFTFNVIHILRMPLEDRKGQIIYY